MIPLSTTAVDALEALANKRFPLDDEIRLHEAMERALVDKGLAVEREVRLSTRERIDFLVGEGVGIEVKIKGSKRAILRQMQRYAAFDRIGELILFTSVATGMPDEINHKRVVVHSAGRAWI